MIKNLLTQIFCNKRRPAVEKAEVQHVGFQEGCATSTGLVSRPCKFLLQDGGNQDFKTQDKFGGEPC